MKAIAKKLFNCPQELMYLVSIMGWGFCKDFLSRFTALKDKYTVDYINQALAGVQAAEDIWNLQQRNYVTGEKRNEFKAAVLALRKSFQVLKRFIQDAFPANTKEMYVAAGQNYYLPSQNGNIDMVRLLVKSMSMFMTKNMEVLKKEGHMTADFADLVNKQFDACMNLSKEVGVSEQTKSTKTINKGNADNDVYNLLLSMFGDAQVIFKDDANLHNFVFSTLLKKVKATRPASMTGKMWQIIDGKKMPLTDVKIQSGEYKAVTDKKGVYKIAAIAAGDYTFTITHDGSAPVQEKITIKGGTRKSFSYTYHAVLAMEMEKNELKVVAA